MLMEHAWDRKFGEPLPTLEDVMREASQDDDDYVSIGWGKYKEKDSVDDPTAPTFKKDDSGAFVPAKGGDKEKEPGDDKEKPEEPKGKALGKGDFERDFDDDPPRGDPDDAWDDEEGRAKPPIGWKRVMMKMRQYVLLLMNIKKLKRMKVKVQLWIVLMII